MATLARTVSGVMDVLRPPKGLIADFSNTVVGMIWIVFIGGLVASATGVAGYLIYSGLAIHWLAQIMVWACQANGSCANFPAMLAGTAVALVILGVLGLAIIAPLMMELRKDRDEISAYDLSLAGLLLDWYRIGPRERGCLLEKLDSSEADTSEEVRRLLYLEHRELEKMDDCG